MSEINQTYDDRVRYTLYNKGLGSMEITEPVGWDAGDDKEYERHKEYHGIMTKFSNNLKFNSDSADFINLVFELEDIQGEIRLTKDEQHPQTDIWTRTYDGYLDLSTREIEDFRVSVKFNSGGIEQTLKSRESENVELERMESMDGDILEPLRTETIQLEGRRIFLQSKWKVEADENVAFLRVQSSDGNTHSRTHGVPFKIVSKSQEQVQDVLESTGTESLGTTGIMFFADSDRTREFRVYSDSIKFKSFINGFAQWAFFKVCLAIYKNGTDYNLKSRSDIFHVGEGASANLYTIQNQFTNISFDRTFTLLAGESASIEFYLKADLLGNNPLSINLTEISGTMNLEEDSVFEPTSTKVIMAYEAAERLVQIATGKKNAFHSEALGRTDLGYAQDGEASMTSIAHGQWVRGFDRLPLPTEGPPKVENLYKPITTSFKDFMTSYAAMWNLGLGIERVGFQERIVIEQLSYFYNRNVTIRLPNQIKKVKRSVATDYYYSSIETGYEKGGTYEEAMGLDEPNGKNTWTTLFTRIKNTYSQISKYRADDYGLEFARRKPMKSYPTEDSTYDSDIFALDLRSIFGNLFRQRNWQDDFETEPTGIFAPDTASNLRLTPLNILFRHGWVIASGLVKYPSDYLRYGSSTANSQLKTKLRGGNAYAENDKILNSEIGSPRFLGEWVEFDHICDFNIMQQIEGFTKTPGGKRIPNLYGLVEYINEEGLKEKGYFFNLKPGGTGKWKILKSSR